jgi:hypothetical protein
VKLRSLIIFPPLLILSGCTRSAVEETPAPQRRASTAESPAAARSKVFDPHVVAGPSLGIDDVISIGEIRGCDSPPGNSAVAGQAALDKRRQDPKGAYANARKELIVQDPSAIAEVKAVTDAIRKRYEQQVLAQIPALPLAGIDSEPFTVRYYPRFSELNDEVTVHGRRLSLRALDAGRERRLVLYYLNYDRVDAERSSVVFMLNGKVNHDPRKFDLDPQVNYAATAAGRLAATGRPVIVFDDTEPTLVRTLAAIRTIDRAVLKDVTRVHVIGFPDAVLHFLAFHESPVASAYVIGGTVPLWTRNDSFFQKDPRTENAAVQDSFQWADLALMALGTGVRLGFASDVGESGLSKAGLFFETLPILRHHPEAERLLSIRGNDRDGDGKGDHGQPCHEGEAADYTRFLTEVESDIAGVTTSVSQRASSQKNGSDKASDRRPVR